MARELEDQNDMVIPRAADKASAFLGVIQKTCQDVGLDLNLQPGTRGFMDKTVVLKAVVKAGRGNQVGLEVFADPQGSALHVGWQATRDVVGGPMSNMGMFGEMNAMARRGAGKAENVRALTGALRSFNDLVFEPVVQQLMEAIRAQQQPTTNGFLGA